VGEWQPGDLALCIADGKRTSRGRVYTVHAVIHDCDKCGCGHYLPYGYAPALWLVGVGKVDADTGCEPWARAVRFRKVTPDAADEFDRETIALLTGKPAKVMEPQP
jgi:hypothetical protein